MEESKVKRLDEKINLSFLGRRYLATISNFFLSRKVAVALLVLMMVILLISVRFPELAVASSPYFLILPAFIFISVLFCTVDRLRKKRVRDAGFWGSIIFHLGLLTVIISAIITRLTLFSGEVLLTEGFTMSLGRDGFLKISNEPIGGTSLQEGSITLKSFRSLYKNNFPIDHEARLILEKGGKESEEVIKVNEPLLLDSLHYTLNRYGFSPAFVVKDAGGNILLDSFINLVVVGGVEDSFEIPGATVYVRFFPDLEMTRKGPATRSRLPNNPAAAVRIKAADGRESGYRLIRKGETSEIMGFQVSFQELRYWAHFLVHRDKGLPIFAAGFFIGVLGLIARFLTIIRERGK